MIILISFDLSYNFNCDDGFCHDVLSYIAVADNTPLHKWAYQPGAYWTPQTPIWSWWLEFGLVWGCTLQFSQYFTLFWAFSCHFVTFVRSGVWGWQNDSIQQIVASTYGTSILWHTPSTIIMINKLCFIHYCVFAERFHKTNSGNWLCNFIPIHKVRQV